MNKSQEINELAKALSKAQGKIRHAVKDSANPFFKSKYADLTSVWDAIREAFQAEGLAVAQCPQVENGASVLETILMHSSGQWMSSTVPLNPVKNDPQGLGSAITYMRRYALQSIAGVCSDDDDGNAASDPRPKIFTQPYAATTAWTPEQTAEYKRLIAEIKDAAWVARFKEDYKGKPPSDIIDALTNKAKG